MAVVKKGDTVRIHYTGRLDDGTVFDSSEGGASLEFKVGDGEFLAGLEDGVLGMSTGEKKTIKIDASQAYGPYRQERIFDCDKNRMPEDFKAEIGQQMQMYRADGMPMNVTIIGITEAAYRMDCNHPLAGKDLTFDIVLEEIL